MFRVFRKQEYILFWSRKMKKLIYINYVVGRAQSSHMLTPMEEDPRNELYKMYTRFLTKYQPRMFVFENVAGLLTARGGDAFKNLTAHLKRVGYEIDFKEQNAADFRVLQKRKRIIIIGWRKGTDHFYPEFEKIRSNATVHDLLDDLAPVERGQENDAYRLTYDQCSAYLKENNIRTEEDVVTHHIARPNNDSQRGASNVYFPVTRTAISIPPWTNPINDLMAEHRRDIDLLIEVLGRDAGLNKSYEKYFEGKFTRDEFNEAYNRLEQNIKDYVELKEMEYNAITHHQQVEFQHDVRYFKAEEVAIKDSLKKYFSRVIKLHRLREVKVLLGYSRLEMPEPEVDDQKQVVKLKSSGPEKWLPAVEINGEGIFIEFNRATMNEWLTNSRVAERSKKYESCYEEYCKQKGWENFKSRNGEYVLIHTLSHMLIKEMAIQSGYSSSALHERIYSSDKMCGLLIYTGAADKEGSLGGLVELGSMEKLIPLLKGALENGLTCTTDPECFMKNPTTDRINGAACHSCTMISETACENGNRLLDRALVVPLPEHEEMGYFKELVNVLCGIQV